MSGMRLREWGRAIAGCLLCAVAVNAAASDEKLAIGQSPLHSGPPANQLTLDQLIDALGSPHYEERQQATELLKAQEKSFTKELTRICPTVQDLEVRLRLVEVAEFLFCKEALMGMGGFLGIEMDQVRPRTRRADPNRIRGVRVRRVIAGTAADKGDVRAGDVVVAIDGTPLLINIDGKSRLSNEDSTRAEPPTVNEMNASLGRTISSLQPYADMTLTILRDGDELIAKVMLGVKPLSLVRQNIDLGRLSSDHLAALEAARQEFARWRAELEDSP